MRVAIVSQQGRKASGAEHALLQFVIRLPQSVDVSWFFFEDGEFAESIRRLYPAVTIVQMSDRVANANRGGLSLNAVSDSAAVISRLMRELKLARPDLVVTNSMKAHIIGSLAARLAGLRCISYIHDIVTGRAMTLLRLVSRICAVERMTCSNLVKRHLRLPRTTVVYAAIETAQFAQLPDRQRAREALGLPAGDVPVVALVGRIARWKGQDRFIRIASAVLARRDAHFCIIGSPIFGCDEEYVEELRADIERLGLGSRLTFVPWQENMQNVYAAIDLACNCSEREPFGRTSLEALASAVPIVCFDDAGVCEVFEQGRGGTHVAAGDESAFADAIVRYLDDPAAHAAARIDARRTAAQMDVTRAYAEFVATIERAARMDVNLDPVPANAPSRLVERQDDECLVT